MMKRMSRLISALLVLAMLCAMVPAAMADKVDSIPVAVDSAPATEVFVGDTFELPMKDACITAKHTPSMKLYPEGSTTAVTGYISGPTLTNNKYICTATRTTLGTSGSYALPGDYVVAKVGCTLQSTSSWATNKCENGTNNYKIKIYDKATGISTSTDSVTIVKGSAVTIDASVLPAATGKQAITAGNDPSGVATAAWSNGKLTITASKTKTGVGYITLYADAGTSHVKSKEIKVTVLDSAVVTVKNGTTVVAQTDTPGCTTVKKGTELKLTAEVLASSGSDTKVTWSSSDPSVASVSSSGVVTTSALGEATIKAALTEKTNALYTVYVIGDVTSLTLKDNGVDTDFSAEELYLSSTDPDKPGSIEVSAVVLPAAAQAGDYVVWSVSDSDILQLDKIGNIDYDFDKDTITAPSVKVTGLKAGKATLIATVGGKSASMVITVWDSKKITGVVSRADYTIRDGSNLLSRFQTKYPTVLANIEGSGAIEVPITWEGFDYAIDKKTVTVRGYLDFSDSSDYTKYTISEKVRAVTAAATLTNDGEVTSNVITASKTNAVAGDKVTFTCKAAAEPSDCTLSYQWYKNGTPISGATGASYTFTVPEASVDSNTTYQFTCGATATRNNVKSTELTSNTVTLNVSRDYSIDLTLDKSSAAYTVGQMPKVTATVYKYSGSTKTAVSNVTGMSWELLDASTEKALSSNIATISGSGNSATITTKAASSASGQKITVQATVSLNGYTYSTKKEITLSAASAGTLTMAAGSGAAIKATTLKSKVSAVVNSSNVTLNYVKFGTPKNCTLTKSSGSSSAIGSTACYFSTTSGQKLSDVYVTLANGASTGSVSYTVYDNNDNTVATGTINFDSSSTGSITCLGIDFADAEAVEMIAEEFPEAEYVKFNALDVKYGRLLLGYKGIVEIDSAKDVKDSDKYYLKNSSSVDGVEELYLLPRTDYYGAINISYTAYSSSKALGEGTLTFTVVRKTASSKFTDVTSANVGSWAADAIDFMADNSLVGGVGNNKFNPTGTMTRCDLVLIMYRMAGQPSVTGVENPFTDVNTNDYFYKAVLWAYKNGVVNGTGADTFSPKKNITREQIASILFRYSGATTASGSLTSFTDAGSVSDYATTAMKWAVGAGIIGGSNGKLDPQGNATRAQVAVMLHRFLNK